MGPSQSQRSLLDHLRTVARTLSGLRMMALNPASGLFDSSRMAGGHWQRLRIGDSPDDRVTLEIEKPCMITRALAKRCIQQNPLFSLWRGLMPSTWHESMLTGRTGSALQNRRGA